jgi:hypothetical protein
VIPLVGASGAISACIGGFVVLLAKTKINFRYLFWFFYRLYNGEFMMPAWLVISFWFLTDLFWAVVGHGNSHDGGVAFAAHVGGTLFGVALILSWKFLPARFKFGHEILQMRAQPVYVQVNPRSNAQEVASIYIFQDGNQLGPFNSSQVLQMRQLGSIGADASYWQEGMPEWVNVSEFSGL